MVFIGGALDSEILEIASADICGHLESSIAPEATFMEKAMQVGLPHSLQFVLGVSLNMSRPFNAISVILLR
jgi:hypothetical protein